MGANFSDVSYQHIQPLDLSPRMAADTPADRFYTLDGELGRMGQKALVDQEQRRKK